MCVRKSQRTSVAAVARKLNAAQRHAVRIMPGFVDLGHELGVYCKGVGPSLSSDVMQSGRVPAG